jgi:hypothetical protein
VNPRLVLRDLVLRLLRRSAFAAAFSLVVLAAVETDAFAFERQWHLGGGLGGVVANGYQLGPALNAYAAYGISDVFDVRLEAAASRNLHDSYVAMDPMSMRYVTRRGERSLLYGAKLALAYKIDVIEWIPYAGASAGFLGVTSPQGRFEAASPSVGGLVGLDYAISRDFGLGVAGFYDYVILGKGSVVSAFLRAEYHLGY